MDIIAASITPPSKGAVAIIKVSGSGAILLIRNIFSAKSLDFDKIEPNHMYLGTIETSLIKDKAFLVYFKEPKSYTGEEMAELHVHGGKSVANSVLRSLYELGARPALNGEFTKRAFLNGKMTLSEAEGTLDIINAESGAEAMQAYRLMSGELSKTIQNSIDKLLVAASNIDAMLDYPDELEEDLTNPTIEILESVRDTLFKLKNSSKNRKYITDGITVALAGLTNVGKSSLMNALLKDDRAIVTDIAGTTRDTLREAIEINGMRLNLVDTAGIREANEYVEAIGIDRAKKAILSADLVLFLVDLGVEETDEEKNLYELFKDKNIIRVGNKADIAKRNTVCDIIIEAKNGKNIDKLIDMIFERLKLNADNDSAVLTRERHIFCVSEALSHIENALETAKLMSNDCLAVDVKAAYSALSEVMGIDVNESIIDKIFSEFCVGK